VWLQPSALGAHGVAEGMKRGVNGGCVEGWGEREGMIPHRCAYTLSRWNGCIGCLGQLGLLGALQPAAISAHVVHASVNGRRAWGG
jgi:hypothetical protein